MVLRMVTAVILGGAIGFERGLKDHPAGLRTHILVALASATFMLVSTQFVFFQHYTKSELIHVDPSRIGSGVVMGVGFLGAGSILRTGFDIHGLTTAASLWLVSAVGLAAGCGMFPEAVTATGVALFVLVGLNVLEAKHKRRVKRHVKIDLDETKPSQAELLAVLNNQGAEVFGVGYDRDLINHSARFRFDVTVPSDQALGTILQPIEALPGVRRVKVTDTRKSAGG
jgi:putative Mg2+ transporter-C (MgtC) family protein